MLNVKNDSNNTINERSRPRVLILSGASIGFHSNTAITMRNLFNGWDSSALAQIYLEETKPDSDVCAHSYYLNPEEFYLGWVASKYKNRFIINKNSPHAMTDIRGPWGTQGSTRIQSILRAWADLLPYRLDERMLDWAKAFRPQVLYTNTGSIRLIHAANVLANQLQVPIVPHFMDDWPSTTYSRDILVLPPRLVMYFSLHRMFKRARLGLAISPYMAEAYRNRFGIPFDSFMNCTDCSAEVLPKLSRESKTLRLVFIGGLHLRRMELLKDFESALLMLRSEGYFVDLNVYAPERDLSMLRSRYHKESPVRLGGTLSFDEIPEKLGEADVLVHMESFDARLRSYTLLSISTKIPQYLAAGRPILVYGPPEIASSRYILDTGTGLQVCNRSVSDLAEAIRTLAIDENLCHTMGTRSRLVASSNHDADRERTRFASALESACN